MVVTADPAGDLDRTYYLPEEVRLVVDVVSPDSEERDRTTKPVKYGQGESGTSGVSSVTAALPSHTPTSLTRRYARMFLLACIAGASVPTSAFPWTSS